jgi:hypothetical protein
MPQMNPYQMPEVNPQREQWFQSLLQNRQMDPMEQQRRKITQQREQDRQNMRDSDNLWNTEMWGRTFRELPSFLSSVVNQGFPGLYGNIRQGAYNIYDNATQGYQDPDAITKASPMRPDFSSWYK